MTATPAGRIHALFAASTLVIAACLAPAQPARAAAARDALPATVSPATLPILKAQAADLDTKPWIADLPEADRPQVVWVRSIWGTNEEHAYRNQPGRAEWARAQTWYITHPRIAWFKDQMIATFIERDLPHASGNTVVQFIVSDGECREWRTAAHFAVRGVPTEQNKIDAADPDFKPQAGTMRGYIGSGLTATQFSRPPQDKLILTGRHGGTGGFMMSASSDDGLNWSDLRPMVTTSKDGKKIGVPHIFQFALHKGALYGLGRDGDLWTSTDGLNCEKIKVESPANGRIGNNETASTFVGDRWVVAQRNGQVSSSEPPYTHWDVNEENIAGPHSHGGPDAITLPDGQVIVGCRGRAEGKEAQLAMLYRYDGKKLVPLIGFVSGGSMTGYPGLTWHDGHLYVSFLQNQPADKDGKRGGGRFCLAKLKWPLQANPSPDGPAAP